MAHKPTIQCVRADNPGPMTASGTNSYVIGDAELAVIDPGPDLPAHRAALLRAIEGRPVFAVFVTHAHRDHSGGAGAFAAAAQAPVFAFDAADGGMSETMRTLVAGAAEVGGGEGVDAVFAPDHGLADGDFVAASNEGWGLRALHTPGHKADHLCFAIEVGGASLALFSGDHVMGWSTSLVSPPDGDMGAYLRSLDKLAARADPVYLPGHGDAVTEPSARVAELTAHRRAREASVLSALSAGPATARALAATVYADTPTHLHPIAERNLLAHLIDLWEREMLTVDGPIAADAVFRRR